MKKLLSILLIIVLCVCCIACGSIKKQTEKAVVDYLINYLGEFRNPESVNVIAAEMNTKEGDFVKLKISAKNSYSETIIDEYILVLNTFSDNEREFDAGTIVRKDEESLTAAYIKRAWAAEGLERWDSFEDFGNVKDVELDVSYINKKLDKYKESKDWD